MVFGLVRDHSSTAHRPRSFPVLSTTHGDDQTRALRTARVWGQSHPPLCHHASIPPSPIQGRVGSLYRHQNPVFEALPTLTHHIPVGYGLRSVGTALKVTNTSPPFNPPKALFLVVVVVGGRGIWWVVGMSVVNPATRRPGGHVRPHQHASLSHNTRDFSALMVKNYAIWPWRTTHSPHQSDPCSRQNRQVSTHLSA